jgi:hypothetical protein
MESHDLKQLETRGYTVIPNFLTPAKLAECVEIYKQLPETYSNKNYSLKKSSTAIIPEVLALLKEITAVTNITANSVSRNTIYFDNSLVEFCWHQDHESYYRWQNSYNSLNFWIPIIKPSADRSGIGIIPYDILQSIVPDVAETQVRNRGAKRFGVQTDGTTKMYNDELGTEEILPVNFNDIGETPAVLPGDLILMREDTIHKTQEITGHRVAMSIRCIDSNSILTAENFNIGEDLKKSMINKNLDSYAELIKGFKVNPTMIAHMAFDDFDHLFSREK